MKQKLKHLLKLSMLCAVIAISSCTQEKEYVNAKNHKEIYFKEKTLDELLKQSFFAEPFSKFAKSSKRISSSAESRTALEENFDFTIVPEMIKVAEKEDGSVSYTFLIERLVKDETFFENLIIDVNATSEYDAFIIKYIPENPDDVFANYNQLTGFDGVKETTFLETSKVFYDSFCFTVIESICYATGTCGGVTYDGPHAPATDGCCNHPVNTAYEICVGGGGSSNPNTGTNDTPNNSQTTSSSTSTGGVGTSGIITVPVTMTPAQLAVKDFQRYTLTPDQLTWLNSQPPTIQSIFYDYLSSTGTLNNPEQEYSLVKKEFVRDLIEIVRTEAVTDANAINFVLQAKTNDKIQNPIDETFLLSVDQFIDLDVANFIMLYGAEPLIVHFSIECAVLRHNHPDWTDLEIYWEASKSIVHIALDAFGLVPVVGEVADLTNGVLYVIEGEQLQATFSFAGAVPIAGWAAAGAKYAIKINEVVTIGAKVKLVWKVTGGVITFGSRNQLRKVLGLLPGNPLQAHHIIPWNKQSKSIVQKASESGNAFHMNEALNGISLNSLAHNGSHANYDNVIQGKFDLFNLDYPNATPGQCYDFLTSLIQQVRDWIATHPNTPINNIVLP